MACLVGVDDFDLLKNKWFQTLGFLLLGHPFHSLEDLGNFTDTSIEL